MSDIRLKQRIAYQFGRAAEQYNQAAEVQVDIARDALEMIQTPYKSMLDIGCGTGRITKNLKDYAQTVWALDLAEGMCRFAKHNHPDAIHWVTGDAESMPFRDGAIQGVFSSMALQWCNPIARVFAEIHRVLEEGGSGVIALLSQGALEELNQSWQEVDHNRHVNRYSTHDYLVNEAEKAGFKVYPETKCYMTYHTTVRELLGSIKSIGANVVTENGNHAPINKSKLQQLKQAYEKRRMPNGLLPLSYQVSFLRLKK